MSLQESKDKLSEIYQRLKTVISAIHLPSRRRFSHCHFRKFTVNLLNFKTGITSTRTLALSSNLDENKDKESEKSHKIISQVSYLLAAPFLPLQTRDQTHLNDARVHRVAEGTAALMYTALPSSQVATGPRNGLSSL